MGGPGEANPHSAKRQDDGDGQLLVPRQPEVPQDEDGRGKNQKVGANRHSELRVPNLCDVETLGPGHAVVPHGGERGAEDKVDGAHREALAHDDGRDGVAYPLLERHDAYPDVLEHDGELGGHVGQDVEQYSADGYLKITKVSGATVYH